jgi:hypothetical protein
MEPGDLHELQQQPLPPAKVLVFDGDTGELTIAPVQNPVAPKDIVLHQIYETGFFHSGIAAHAAEIGVQFNGE